MYQKVKVPKVISKQGHFRPGQRKQTRGVDGNRGGGGPGNAGAITEKTRGGAMFAQSQPSWGGEFASDYLGHARPSTTPDLSGIPQDNFRGLGDNHGGRQ